MAKHLRQDVRFPRICAIVNDPTDFTGSWPGETSPLLVVSIQQDQRANIISSVRVRKRSDLMEVLLHALGRLWLPDSRELV